MAKSTTIIPSLLKRICFALSIMIAALLAWQAAAEVLSADELERQLTRGPVIRKKVKIDEKDDYTSPETSAFISMPSILFVKGSAKLESSSMRQLDEMAKALVDVTPEHVAALLGERGLELRRVFVSRMLDSSRLSTTSRVRT